MKKYLVILLSILMLISFSSCGKEEKPEDDSNEIALISLGDEISDSSINQAAWKKIQEFCEENEKTCRYYLVKEGAPDKEVEGKLKTAIDKGGKLIFFMGECFEKNVYDAQKEYSDVDFSLIDGVPNNGDGKFDISANSQGVLFAEEEAGYLAGYAAVKEGYTTLGFIGGSEEPNIKRYGYGFVQGIKAAAKIDNVDGIRVNYSYSENDIPSNAIKDEASKWYGEGVQVIFAAGDKIGSCVLEAAQAHNGKVIDIDGRLGEESEYVLTTTRKGIGIAVEDALKEYRRENFIGNTVVYYSAKNNGVGIKVDEKRFTKFTEDEYEKVLKLLEDGSVTIKKDNDVDSVTDLSDEQLKIELF